MEDVTIVEATGCAHEPDVPVERHEAFDLVVQHQDWLQADAPVRQVNLDASIFEHDGRVVNAVVAQARLDAVGRKGPVLGNVVMPT